MSPEEGMALDRSPECPFSLFDSNSGRRHQRGDSWPLRVSRARADYFDHILKSVTAVECSVEEELEDDHWTSFGARCVPLQTTDLEMDSVSGWSRYKGDKHCEQEEEFSGDAATRQHITRLAEGALKAEVARLVRAEMDVLPHATEVVGAQWIENYVFRSLQHLLPVLFQQLCALREQRQDFKYAMSCDYGMTELIGFFLNPVATDRMAQLPKRLTRTWAC